MKKFYLFAFIAAVIFAGCAKNGAVGPTGSNGPQGATGVDGPAGVPGGAGPVGVTGPAGPTGAAGAPGTVTFMYSDWVTATNDTYEDQGQLGLDTWHISAPAITASVLSGDLVIVYYKGNGTAVQAFPFETFYPMLGVVITQTWEAHFTPGNIRLTMQFTNVLPDSQGDPYTTITYRYVIVTSPVVHSMGNINIKNYSQVKQALHLPD